jgi:hypothetical protein
VPAREVAVDVSVHVAVPVQAAVPRAVLRELDLDAGLLGRDAERRRDDRCGRGGRRGESADAERSGSGQRDQGISHRAFSSPLCRDPLMMILSVAG